MSEPTAVCVRCGTLKTTFDRVCTACGHRPDGEGLLVAWLLSDAYLAPTELREVAARVRSGSGPSPSPRQLEAARRALGVHASVDPGLGRRERLALVGTNLVLTPAVGWTLWWWWRLRRPTAAWQALHLTWPASVFLTALQVWRRFG